MANPMPPSLPPGFRFHPTDEELILHYLRNHAAAFPCPVSIITEVDIYKFDPWDLPRKAMFGDQEWYFFSPRDRKYPNGVRPNRAAASGYWKATGTDKSIAAGGGKKCIGVKKALAFYQGKPPKGLKTNWMMHEYRLSESTAKNHRNVDKPLKLKDSSMRLDEWVLCRIYEKSNQVQEDSTLPCLEEELPHENKLNLPKSASLTELFKEADFSVLSRLLEVPVEAPAPEQNPFGYADWNQTFDNPNPMSGIDQYSSVSDAPNGVKHQRWVVEEEGNNNNSWAYNQFDSQAFFNQQLLLQSHLGMQ